MTMNKVQNANVELHNITKAINWVLFAESTKKEDKQFIFDQINKIFGSDVSEHSFINDMPWTDPTMKQMDQLKGLIEELQERYVIGSEGPCMECGKYFMPGERIYRMGDGDYMCKKCRDRKFKTERAWSEYNVMVNEAVILTRSVIASTQHGISFIIQTMMNLIHWLKSTVKKRMLKYMKRPQACN